MKKIPIVLIIVLSPFLGNTQNLGVGVSAMYNFQSESLGIGARANIYPNNTISYVPQFSYYSIGIGSISEFTIGLSIEAKIIRGNTINYYLLAHGGYNRWLNASSSGMEGASSSNWNLEGGVGITSNRCLRPFLEYRYNIKFQETHLRLGLLYIFGCNSGGNGYRNTNKIRKMTVCPAYN